MSGKAFHQVLAFNSPATPDHLYLEKNGDYVKFYATDDNGNGLRVGHSPSEMVSDIDSQLGDSWRTNSIDAGTF